MKKLLILIATLVFVACGSGTDNEETAVQPTHNLAWANLSAAEPTADIGFGDCRIQASLEEANARTESEVVLGGVVLTYRYDTVDGAYYLSEDGSKSLQVFEDQGYARVSISCPK
ncbi:MAG TPA: hypothetical protein V6C65_38900 [Allocoleopsis sp.]